MDLILGLVAGEMTPRKSGKIMNQDKAEMKERMKDTEVVEKIEEVREEVIEGRTMVTPEPKDSAMGEVVMTTADKEVVHEESARRLQAKGSLL